MLYHISTHALTEGDVDAVIVSAVILHFNSRPHGGRRRFSASCGGLEIFQLTPSRRATSSSRTVCGRSEFQLTPSRRATFRPIPYRSTECISTHALTEGDENCNVFYILNIISTHALTEGDCAVIPGDFRTFISTHALTEGDRAETLLFLLF